MSRAGGKIAVIGACADASAALRDDPAAATATVVLLVRDPAGAARDLPPLLPGRALSTLSRDDLRGLGPIALWRRLRALRSDEIVFLVDDLDAHEAIGRLLAALAAPTAKRRLLLDRAGRSHDVTLARFLGRDVPFLAWGAVLSAAALARTRLRLARLARAPRRPPRPAMVPRVCYLRSELWSGIAAGGSVGHTSGVAAGLRARGCEVDFVATARPVGVDPRRHALTEVRPRRAYTVSREIPALAHSFVFEAGAALHLDRRPAGLLYQRFDPASHAGVALARATGTPLVLEYNGPEVWIADHWGKPLRRRRLFETVEAVNLTHADLISVVSEPLRDLLKSRGVEDERILVSPNGVDPQAYRPDLEAAGALRGRLPGGAVVAGFIGTFEAWHGAEVLARAAARVVRARPRAFFVFVGDGPGRGACERALFAAGVAGRCLFTGLVPQPEGAAHLAAMDILVAPHVPNPDGSRFFGSPTKIFEYMAMGRAIVASRLEQIGDILEDGRTALLVPPGDEAALADALVRLVDDAALRERLGAAARGRAVEAHTWDARVAVLLERLRARGLIAWS